MDDVNQQSQQNQIQQAQQQTVAPPQQNVSVAQPIGTPLPTPRPALKEQMPAVPVMTEAAPLIAPSETEPEIVKELADIGVEKVSHTPTITEDHKNAGLELAKESVPVTTAPSGMIQLPITEEEAVKTVKFHKKISDSIVWLAMIILRQIKIAHQRVIN